MEQYFDMGLLRQKTHLFLKIVDLSNKSCIINNMWTRTIIEDPNRQGEYILDLGDEICDTVGWKPGDTLIWIDNKDGTWTLRKKTTMLTRCWQSFVNRLKTLMNLNRRPH